MSARWPIVIAAVCGGALVMGLQAWLGPFSEDASTGQAGASAPAVPVTPPPPDPGDPSAAVRLVEGVLEGAHVPSGSISRGLYPLHGPDRPQSATLPLVSFTCPQSPRCGVILDELSRRAPAAGLTVTAPLGGDRPDRPRYRAFFDGERPTLALRAYPPGPRLAVVRLGTAGGHERHPHVTFALRPDRPEGPEQALDLMAREREVWVALPPVPPEAHLTEGLSTWLSQGAAGVMLSADVDIDMDAAPWIRFARALKREGAPFLEEPGGAGFDLRTLSIRGRRFTHLLDPDADLEGQLKAIEASMVLDGEVVVVVPDDAQAWTTVSQWLSGLTRAGTRLFRLSEMVR
ncbi:MAG: hypothetical protein ACE366_18870 [Bradymonadia bacterium]